MATITVNGAPLELPPEASHVTLLRLLRQRGLTGTKEGCAEGDCGACSVLLLEDGAWKAINACIAFAAAFEGRELVTVEGLAQHPVQRAMVERYGSQCGFCTPGFVIAMTEGYYRGVLGPEEIIDQLNGNLCRCTGYRPIRDAMIDALAARTSDDKLRLRLLERAPAMAAIDREAFARPTTLEELFRALEGDAVILGERPSSGSTRTRRRARSPSSSPSRAFASSARSRAKKRGGAWAARPRSPRWRTRSGARSPR